MATVDALSVNGEAVLGYWDCRGLAHAIVLVLEYTDTKYIFVPEKTSGPSPIYDKKAWMSKKRSYLRGFDFPNLPYLYVPASSDGRHSEARLTQSMAILKWLGRRHDLVPHGEKESVDTDLFVEQARDLCEAITEYAYFPAHRQKGTNPTGEEILAKRATLTSSAAKLLSDIAAKYSKSSGPFLVGAKPTYADFFMYEMVDHIRLLLPDIVLDADLKRFLEAVESLPRLKAYLASDRFRPFPLWSERSYIGRSPDNL